MSRSEINTRAIPAIVKHMTVAIFKKLSGSEKKKFLEAIKIARASLLNNKLTQDRLSQGFDALRLTAEGMKRNREHLTDNGQASRQFDYWLKRYGSSLVVATLPETGTDKVGTESDSESAEQTTQKAREA